MSMSIRSLPVFKGIVAYLTPLIIMIVCFSPPVSADTTGPVLGSFSPAPGAAITNQGQAVTFAANDPDGINQSSVKVKINGTSVPVTVKFAQTGHWEEYYDSCSGYYSVWVVDGYDYTKATVTASPGKLPDNAGIWVSVTDNAVNTSTGEWSFTCMVAPTINSLSPANNTIVTTAQPAISAKVTDNGVINGQSIIMKLGTSVVNHSFDQQTGAVSYVPASPLGEGTHSVYLEVKDTAGNLKTASWSFRVGLNKTGPVLGGFAPVQGSSQTNTSQIISFTADDPDWINRNSIQVKLNGTVISASVTYPSYGHYEQVADSCTGQLYNQWVIDGYDYTKATIKTSSVKLSDKNTVWVTASDDIGNISTAQWSFDCMVPPVISSLTPANNAIISIAHPNISAKITDNGTINQQSIILKIGSVVVNHSFDPQTGVVSYLPTDPLPEGANNVYLEVKDTAGNVKNASWSFWVGLNKTGPVLTGYSPANGATITNANPVIGFTATDPDGVNSSGIQVKINGASLPVRVTYPSTGHYETFYDTCTGQPYNQWVIDGYDYTIATVTASASQVPDINSIWVSAADKLGNVTTGTWSFTNMTPPTFSNFTPANGTNAASATPTISAKVTDNGAVDQNSIVLKVSGIVVNHTFIASGTSTGTVSYTPPVPLETGVYNITLEAKDTAGNAGTTSWAFSVGQGTAQFTGETPVPGSDVTIVDPNIKVEVTDIEKLDKNSLMLTVNGQQVNAAIAFKGIGHWETMTDSCDGTTYQVWIIDGYEYNKGTITAKATTLEDGTNNINVSVKNINGGPSNHEWSFVVKVPPQISQAQPAANSSTTNQRPLISAAVTDNGGFPQVSMLVDGIKVTPSFDPFTGIVSYIPAEPLENGMDHYIQVTAVDGIGMTTTLSWKFHIQIYPDMPATNVPCVDCHIGYPAPNHPMDNCDGCHGGSRPIDDCRSCHGWGAHSPSLISWYNCDYCHNSTYSYKIPIHPADVGSYHITTTAMDSCRPCHLESLTTEHYQHTDDFGNRYNCETCHASSRAEVRQAISGGQKNCDVCHGEDGHDELHVTTVLDSNCASCHKNNLTQEHLNNPVTQTDSVTGQLKQWNCSTCHSNQADSVINSITTNNKHCASCHSEGHGLGMAEIIPADIPLYAGFKWSIPAEASLWGGEAWMPNEFLTGGKIIISDRRTDISGDAVWEFYVTEMQVNGWSLVSEVPDSGANSYPAEFSKGSRKAVIWFYGGETHGDVTVSTGGYRLEILYK